MADNEIYSHKITKGSRNYFFDIKKSEKGDLYLKISEIKKPKPTDGKTYSVEKNRKTHKQAYLPWTTEDDNKLELLFCEGKKVK